MVARPFGRIREQLIANLTIQLHTTRTRLELAVFARGCTAECVAVIARRGALLPVSQVARARPDVSMFGWNARVARLGAARWLFSSRTIGMALVSPVELKADVTSRNAGASTPHPRRTCGWVAVGYVQIDEACRIGMARRVAHLTIQVARFGRIHTTTVVYPPCALLTRIVTRRFDERSGRTIRLQQGDIDVRHVNGRGLQVMRAVSWCVTSTQTVIDWVIIDSPRCQFAFGVVLARFGTLHWFNVGYTNGA